VGGLANARAIHDLCQAAGWPVWAGGMMDMGIGRQVKEGFIRVHAIAHAESKA